MKELLLLLVFSLFIALACFGTIGWVFFSGVEIGVERIFLVIVCTVLGFLFVGISGWIGAQMLPVASAKPAANPKKPTARRPAATKQAPKQVSKASS